MVVEANRDAAKECVLKAKEAMLAKNFEKMRRLLQKAKNLDPNCNVERKINKLATMITKINLLVKIYLKMDTCRRMIPQVGPRVVMTLMIITTLTTITTKTQGQNPLKVCSLHCIRQNTFK
jgi:site-specific recombinase